MFFTWYTDSGQEDSDSTTLQSYDIPIETEHSTTNKITETK